MRWFYRVVIPYATDRGVSKVAIAKKYGKWLAEFRYLKDANRFARLYPGAQIYKDEVI